jgi:hypothetical protein
MIYLYLRQTVDWSDEVAFLAQLPERLRPRVELWNETFDLPFHLFRHEVRRIAEQNHAAVEDAEVVPIEEVPPGGLVVPTDDDDWFAPDLGQVLGEARGPDTVGLRWPSLFLEIPLNLKHRLGRLRRRVFPRTSPRWACTTNNYALVADRIPKILFDSHLRASAALASGQVQFETIDRDLSIMNRTLGSQTSLGHRRPTFRRPELLRRYRWYARLYEKGRARVPEWCRPYVRRMADLMEGLRPR